MMRRFAKIYCSTMAIVAMLATTALAGDLGLVVNGDVEVVSRFAPHGNPGVDHPNGYPDGWHHSSRSAWSSPLISDPFTSSNHSLYLPDDNGFGQSTAVHEEHRSFVTVLPGVGDSGRILALSWNWNWNITGPVGDQFSATVRTSTQPVLLGNLDLQGMNNGPGDPGPDFTQIRDHVYLTDGTPNSNGFDLFLASIPLLAAEQTFDIIFRTRDNVGTSSEMGVMFVDDISANVVPEPATMGMLGLAGLGLMLASRRRRG